MKVSKDDTLPMLKTGNRSVHNSQDNSQLGQSQSRFNPEDDKGSPFKLPTDDEIFHYRENEKIRKLESKHNTRKLKIWDKQTASMSNPLRSFKHHVAPNSEAAVSEKEGKKKDKYQSYSERERLLITQAIDTINVRRKERENLKNQSRKKETMSDVVEQKKEIFLVTMTTQIVKEERKKLIEMANEKNNALDESDKMLILDNENFKKFGDETKLGTQTKMDEATKEAHERATKVREIKFIQQQLTSLRADNNKMEENASTYKDLKKFLEMLTPNEFMDQKSKKLQEIIADERQTFISDRQTGSGAKLQDELNTEFDEALDRNEIEAVEDFEDNYPLYFNDPDDVIDIFTDLEENNLYLVQATQD
jgi:membrane-bound inhibitor of C-type lysozyme